MAISLSDYKARLRGGVGRRNSYQVFIDNMPEGLELFIRNSQIPSYSSNPMNIYFLGRELKLPGMPRAQTWNITMYSNIINNRFEALAEFWSWYNDSFGLYSNVGPLNQLESMRQVRISPLADDRDTELAEFVLLDAFITEMQPVDLSFDSEDPLEFNVVIQWSEMVMSIGDEVVYGPNET